MRDRDAGKQADEDAEHDRQALEHQQGRYDHGDAERDHEIFAEADVLARLVEAPAHQRGLRDQGRRQAFHAAGAGSHQLADLGLRVGRQDAVGMALFQQLHAALDRLARVGTAERLAAEQQGAHDSDRQDDDVDHDPSVRPARHSERGGR